ncbi:MAG: hypothetical protein ACD_11C00020G0022 [uncultured bacterium]|nr:MAG: hypothetical protein ACD_11C00020G0022 [uncultured bacterium]HBR71307.1 RNA 2',3'-cyclic phosphodiesterase [Candidatus Moranbacteria bacterium]
MQKRKIFIEIGIPSKLRKKLTEKVEKLRELPVKWTKPENLHITLMFLGYVDESVIPEICLKVSQTASEAESFDLSFDKIELGPNPDKAQMIWFSGEANDDLKNLYQEIEKELGIFHIEKKLFRPHITLGKIKKEKWEALKEAPVIQEEFKTFVPVENIFVMGSVSGQEYEVIEDCPLG